MTTTSAASNILPSTAPCLTGCRMARRGFRTLPAADGLVEHFARRPLARRIAMARRHVVAAAAGGLPVKSSSEYSTLKGKRVFSAATGQPVELTSLWPAQPGTKVVVAFLTHFADLSSTEFAQKLQAVLPQLQAAGVGLIAVGLGEPEKARRFSELVGFPLDLLYADPEPSLYRELDFNAGFLPETNISAYAKLVAMLAGVGSPGTIQEVLRGYIGDRSAKPVFSDNGSSNLFDVLGKDYQRPFELATLRLFNMQLVLSHWSELCPSDERLLTQQGGCLGFNGQEVIFKHVDSGILKYADVDKLVAAMVAEEPAAAAPSQVLRTLL